MPVVFTTLTQLPRWLMRGLASALLAIVTTLICVVAGLFAYDLILGIGQPPARDLVDRPTMASLELYPFTGLHMPARMHHTASGQDINSGELGFWSPDFDFRSPPVKAKNELRVILIGGSGAQGQAPDAVRDDLTLHRQIEKRLQELLPGRAVRVVSMAMGGSTTYQNYIALNLWGHAIAPDMIVSYSGFNEWHVPLDYERAAESFMGFARVAGLSLAAQPYEWPPSLRWLPRWFPNIAARSRIALPLKLWADPDYFTHRATDNLRQNLRQDFTTDAELVSRRALPFHASALKSIKRDFAGIPIALVWQIVDRTSFDFFTRDTDHTFAFETYDQMFGAVRSDLAEYINDDWIFWNAHHDFLGYKQNEYTFHLSVRAQEDVGRSIAERIGPRLAAIKVRP